MPATAIKYWVLLLLLLGAIYGSFVIWRQSPTDQVPAAVAASESRVSTSRKPTPTSSAADGPVAPFKLTDQDGNEFDSESLDGQVWVASFFFTNCPAICWRMNQALSAWQQTHPDSNIRFISITCDPDNDTPEALQKYAEHFKADPQRWTFLTGDMDEIQAIGQESFKIAVVKGDHSDRACVVDRQGQIRGRFRITEPDQAELLDRLLTVVEGETPPAAEPDATGSAAEPAAAQSADN